MSLLRFARLSDAPPPARELLVVEEDGRLAGWRSIATVVGRFAGTAHDAAGLRALVDAAVAAPPPSAGTLPHDATIETIEARGIEAAVGERDEPGGPWGALYAACRELLDGPVAAVAGVGLVLEGADLVRLEHRGTEPLPVFLESAVVEVIRWRAGDLLGSREVRGLGPGRVVAGRGWSVAVSLPVEAGPVGEPGDRLTASARFVAEDGGVYIPVLVMSASGDR